MVYKENEYWNKERIRKSNSEPRLLFEGYSSLKLDTGVGIGKGPQRLYGRWKNNGVPAPNVYDGEQINKAEQYGKYPEFEKAVIGSDPTGKINNIVMLKAHKSAFVGRDSPGPMYDGRRAYPFIQKQYTWSVPFGIKSQVGSMYKRGDDNPNVGPNSYPPMTSLGPQLLSSRRNPHTAKFTTAPKFPRTRKSENANQTPIERNLSSFGKQTNKKTEMSVGFTRGTRKQAEREQRCLVDLDKGPMKDWTKPKLPHIPPTAMINPLDSK